MIDYHVHLWPHDQRAEADEQRLERLAIYCEQAGAAGVDEIALTEHLFRFEQVQPIAERFWDSEANAGLSHSVDAYFAHHATADLDTYVEHVLQAKAAGLPLVLGLEVDYYPGKMDKVAALLDGYPFDVLLGSVHWLGSWLFDALEDDVAMAEWAAHRIEDVWSAYVEALEELAATRTTDVLAHPDLIKLTGAFPDPGYLHECEVRIAEAARSSGLAAELSSAGLRKPVGVPYCSPSLLEELFARAVPITCASDSHGPDNVGQAASELATLARTAGYGSLRAFRQRQPLEVPIGDPDATTR